MLRKILCLFFIVVLFLCIGGCAAASNPAESLSTASPCIDAEIQSTLPVYTPSFANQFVTLRDGHFAIGDSIFNARGVNYYPAQFPWRRFLTESDIDTIRNELLLLRTTGFNSLRLFLWNAALFTCDATNAATLSLHIIRHRPHPTAKRPLSRRRSFIGYPSTAG